MSNVVRISDGLGNQLFQYAFAYSVYKRTGEELILDPMFISPIRSYQLDKFHIDFSKRYVGEKLDYILGFGPKKARRFRLQYRERKMKKDGYELVKERKELEFDEPIYSERPAYYIGFWQSYKYFDEFYEDIKRQIVLKDKLGDKAQGYSNQIKENISVSLHIRRTDYNRDVNNVCLNDTFYAQALKRMQEELGEFKLFIFTDDKEFVKQNFQLYDYIIVEGTSDLEDFTLMQQCKHHIIANSTFSWWAAYLAENKGGIVYAPLADIWTRDFYLPEWNCIETKVGNAEWK